LEYIIYLHRAQEVKFSQKRTITNGTRLSPYYGAVISTQATSGFGRTIEPILVCGKEASEPVTRRAFDERCFAA
jgi:hypothetical protein